MKCDAFPSFFCNKCATLKRAQNAKESPHVQTYTPKRNEQKKGGQIMAVHATKATSGKKRKRKRATKKARKRGEWTDA